MRPRAVDHTFFLYGREASYGRVPQNRERQDRGRLPPDVTLNAEISGAYAMQSVMRRGRVICWCRPMLISDLNALTVIVRYRHTSVRSGPHRSGGRRIL